MQLAISQESITKLGRTPQICLLTNLVDSERFAKRLNESRLNNQETLPKGDANFAYATKEDQKNARIKNSWMGSLRSTQR